MCKMCGIDDEELCDSCKWYLQNKDKKLITVESLLALQRYDLWGSFMGGSEFRKSSTGAWINYPEFVDYINSLKTNVAGKK